MEKGREKKWSWNWREEVSPEVVDGWGDEVTMLESVNSGCSGGDGDGGDGGGGVDGG